MIAQAVFWVFMVSAPGVGGPEIKGPFPSQRICEEKRVDYARTFPRSWVAPKCSRSDTVML